MTNHQPGNTPLLRGPVLTTKQAADYCGMPTQSLYNRLSKATGPKVHKHGARNKFLLGESANHIGCRFQQPMSGGLAMMEQ